jgi:cobalt-precorrin 5A hydrolase
MVVGEAMIVAGIGSRKGVGMADVIAAIEAALKTHGFAMTELSALATTGFKRDEEAIFAAGRQLGLPVILVEADGLDAVVAQTLSHSDLSISLAGTPSVSESAALAGAGEGASLAGPRIAVGSVTCAIAISGARP